MNSLGWSTPWRNNLSSVVLRVLVLNGNWSKLPYEKHNKPKWETQQDSLDDKWLNKESEFSTSLAGPLRHYIAQIIPLMLVHCLPKCDSVINHCLWWTWVPIYTTTSPSGRSFARLTNAVGPISQNHCLYGPLSVLVHQHVCKNLFLDIFCLMDAWNIT